MPDSTLIEPQTVDAAQRGQGLLWQNIQQSAPPAEPPADGQLWSSLGGPQEPTAEPPTDVAPWKNPQPEVPESSYVDERIVHPDIYTAVPLKDLLKTADPKKVKAFTGIAEKLSRLPPLSLGEHASALKVRPEDQGLFKALLQRQYGQERSMKKAGYGNRLLTSFIQGGMDWAMPMAKMTGAIPKLTPEQERFKQELMQIREGVDPVIQPDTSWLGKGVQQTSRMAFPMISSIAAGKAMGGAGKLAGLGKRGVRGATAVGTSGSFLPQIADQTYTSLIGEGVDPEQAKYITAVSAPLESLMESILPDPFQGYGQAFKGTVRQVVGKVIKKYGVNVIKENVEEGLQGVINETAMEVGRRLDEEIPNKGLGNILVQGARAMKESAVPLALMIGPGAVVGSAQATVESAARPAELERLRGIRAGQAHEQNVQGMVDKHTPEVDLVDKLIADPDPKKQKALRTIVESENPPSRRNAAGQAWKDAGLPPMRPDHKAEVQGLLRERLQAGEQAQADLESAEVIEEAKDEPVPKATPVAPPTPPVTSSEEAGTTEPPKATPENPAQGVTFYRGTRKEGGPTDPGDMGEGDYHSTDKTVAATYGTVGEGTELDLKNPLVTPQKRARRLLKDDVLPDKRIMPRVRAILGEERVAEIQKQVGGATPADLSQAFTQAAKEFGYDGVIFKPEGKDAHGMEAVVFDAKQIPTTKGKAPVKSSGTKKPVKKTGGKPPKMYHQVGFMPGSVGNVSGALKQGVLQSKTGLVFLRSQDFADSMKGMAEYENLVGVELTTAPNLLVAPSRAEVMKQLGVKGHTDTPSVAAAVAKSLRDKGFDGYEIPTETAILSDVPHKVTPRDIAAKKSAGKQKTEVVEKPEAAPPEFAEQSKSYNKPGVKRTFRAVSGDRVLLLEQNKHSGWWSITEMDEYTGEVKGKTPAKTKGKVLASDMRDLRKAKDVAERIADGTFDPEADLEFDKEDTKNIGQPNGGIVSLIKRASAVRVGMFTATLREHGWVTDGHILMKVNDKDRAFILSKLGKVEGRAVNIEPILKDAKKQSLYSVRSMTPVAYRGGDISDRSVVLKSRDGDYFIVVDKELHDTVQKKHPGAIPYGKTGEGVAYRKDDELVAVIMPLQVNKPDAQLKSLMKGTYWDKPTSQPKTPKKKSPPKPVKETEATKPKDRKAELAEEYDALIRSLSDPTKPKSGPDPELLVTLAKIAANRFEFGIRALRDFLDSVKTAFGDRYAELEPHLTSAWNDVVARNSEAALPPPSDPPSSTPSTQPGGDDGNVPLADKGMVRSLGHFFQRFFTAPGELPADVYDAKIRKEGRVAKEMNKLRFAATDFRRGVRRGFGRPPTAVEAKQMNKVLRGEAGLESVPEEVRAPVRAFRDHLDSLSRQLIAEGVAQGDLVGIITEGMGVYATRSYRIFDDPKHRDKVPAGVRNRAVAAIREMHPDKSNAEIAGIMESLLYRGAAESPVGLLKGSKLGSKDLSTFMRRKDIPKWLRELWGEYEDAGVNYARSVFKMAHLLANQQFLNEVREAGLGAWLRTAEEGPIVNEHGEVVTKIATDGSSVMEPLNGMYTTPEIKAAFERLDSPGAIPDWLRIFMTVNYAVKYGKTVGSWMTHMRNFVANPGFAVMNGHWRVNKAGKAAWATATGMFQLPDAEYRKYYERLAELKLVGEDVRAGELNDALRDAHKSADIEEFTYAHPARGATRVSRGLRAAYRFTNALYQAEDGVWKIFAFENEKARYAKAFPGWSQQQVEERAAQIVRDTYPTYSKISEGIKAARRFPVVGTFVSFPAEVVRTTFHTARIAMEEMKAPETRAIGAQRLVGTIVSLGGTAALSAGAMAALGIGGDDDDDLRWFVPPWQENSIFMYTSKPENANYRFVDMGYTDPHAYLTDAVMAFVRGDDWSDSLASSLGEFLRPFTSEEILTKAVREAVGNNTDNGQRVYNPRDTAGEQAKDITWHMWKNAMEPGTISSGRRITEAISGTNPNREVGTEITAFLTGFRKQKVDIEHSLGFRVRDFGKALTDIQGIARKTATSRGRATKKMVATDVARMETLRLAAFSEMQQIVGAARRQGVPEKTIRTMLVDELPDVIAEQILTEDYSPYAMTPQTARQMMNAKPLEFKERFDGWHGEKAPEAARSYARTVVGGIPYKPPTKEGKSDDEHAREVGKQEEKLRATKQILDALEFSTYDKALRLLVEHYRRPGKDGKAGHERRGSNDFGKKAKALAVLYYGEAKAVAAYSAAYAIIKAEDKAKAEDKELKSKGE